MSEATVHRGSCHCGAVTWTATMAPPEQAAACNCSICGRMGWRLAFVGRDQFTLESGEQALVDYQFGHHRIHHVFCGTCGIRSFARGTDQDGSELVCLNLRCVEGLDVESLPVHWYDGASL